MRMLGLLRVYTCGYYLVAARRLRLLGRGQKGLFLLGKFDYSLLLIMRGLGADFVDFCWCFVGVVLMVLLG